MAGKLTMKPMRLVLFKSSSTDDERQVPAEAASVTFYKRGATVRTGTSVLTTDTVVTVYNRGRVAASDSLQLGTDSAKTFAVTSVTDTTITLRSTTGSSIAVAAGDRFVITTAAPTMYSDEVGVTTIANPRTVTATGEVLIYTPELFVDYIVSGTGLTTQLVIDEAGGWVRGSSSWINAKDYPTIQAAVDALPSTGGTVFIPSGTYNSSSTPAFTGVTLSVDGTVLRGEGWGNTVLQTTSTSTNMISIAADSCRVCDLSLQGPDSAGTGYGIYVNSAGADPLYYTTIERVYMDGTASYGLYIRAVCVMVKVANCVFADAKSGGSVYASDDGGGGNTLLEFDGCLFAGPGYGTVGGVTKGVVHIDGGATHTFKGCGFQTPNADDSTYLSLDSVHNVALYNCYFEKGFNNPTKFLITTTGFCFNVVIDNLYAYLPGDGSGTGGEPKLLNTDSTSSGLIGFTLKNLFMNDNQAAASITADIDLNSSFDSGVIESPVVVNYFSGVHRKLVVTGTTTKLAYQSAYLSPLTVTAPALRLPLHTAAEIAAMTGMLKGSLAFDSTNNDLVVYDGTNWVVVGTQM